MVILGVLLNIVLILNKSMTSAPATSSIFFPLFSNFHNRKLNQKIPLYLFDLSNKCYCFIDFFINSIVYRQLLGHPAPRTRTQVAKLKLAVTRTPKKCLSTNFITPITPKIGYLFFLLYVIFLL